MNVSSIKKLIETYTLDELLHAEEALLSETPAAIDIEGKDAGEQLTHLLAAIWCKNQMHKEGVALNVAVRNYSQRVRNSIN